MTIMTAVTTFDISHLVNCPLEDLPRHVTTIEDVEGFICTAKDCSIYSHDFVEWVVNMSGGHITSKDIKTALGGAGWWNTLTTLWNKD